MKNAKNLSQFSKLSFQVGKTIFCCLYYKTSKLKQSTVSCLLINDRDIFDWANLRVNVEFNSMDNDPSDL